ncbi:putative acetyltransferase [Mycobacteroides abscessus M94]|nr:putative acetyltransferase [Mycobacteroides abscessus M94]
MGSPELGTARRAEAAGHSAAARRDPAGPRSGVALARAAASVRPTHPHWYLATIGAAVPGRGIGSALLKHQIDQIEGPAYLESSNIRNNPLYERFGFKVVEEIKPTTHGPSLWAMYRD